MDLLLFEMNSVALEDLAERDSVLSTRNVAILAVSASRMERLRVASGSSLLSKVSVQSRKRQSGQASSAENHLLRVSECLKYRALGLQHLNRGVTLLSETLQRGTIEQDEMCCVEEHI